MSEPKTTDNRQPKKSWQTKEPMQLTVGKKYDVSVIKVNKNGIIVRMVDGSTQFIHISKLSTKFIDDINKYVKVGNKYYAIAVESEEKGAELSLIHLNLEPIYAEDFSVESMEDVMKFCNFDYTDKFEGMPYRRTKTGKKKYSENIWEI